MTQGSGSSESGGGIGTTTYAYASSGTTGGGPNSWTNKTTVTQPNGTMQTHYFNAQGEEMLSVISDGTHFWGNFIHYDSSGRPDYTASPAAVNITSLSTIEPYMDLLNSVSGNYQYLNDSSGQISTTSYYYSTTASSSTAGGIAGYVSDNRTLANFGGGRQ